MKYTKTIRKVLSDRRKLWWKNLKENNPEKWQAIIKKSRILHKEDIKEREKRYIKTLQGRFKLLRNNYVEK